MKYVLTQKSNQIFCLSRTIAVLHYEESCRCCNINLIFWNIICVIFCPTSMSFTNWVSGLAINCNLGKKFFKLTRYFDDLNWMKLNSIVHDLLLLMLINGLWLSALRSTNLIIICNANLKAPKCLMKISLAVMKC